MIIFVLGVHGVGKSYLSSFFAESNCWLHKSASDLIKQSGSVNWGNDKKVKDIVGNQRPLVSAILNLKTNNRDVLIDGHAALLDINGNVNTVDSSVFKAMELDGLILLEEDADIIRDRFRSRGKGEIEYDLETLQKAERDQTLAIAHEAHIPVRTLYRTSHEDFSTAIFELAKTKETNPV